MTYEPDLSCPDGVSGHGAPAATAGLFASISQPKIPVGAGEGVGRAVAAMLGDAAFATDDASTWLVGL